jgi:hypothetical protein
MAHRRGHPQCWPHRLPRLPWPTPSRPVKPAAGALGAAKVPRDADHAPAQLASRKPAGVPLGSGILGRHPGYWLTAATG